MVTEKTGRNRAIVDMAIAGTPPASIAEQFPGVSRQTVSSILTAARKRGEPVPRFKGGGSGTIVADDPPAAPAGPEPGLSAADEARLADLAARGVGVTGIAALMGKRYAVIFAALDRLGLSRVAP